MNITLKDFKHFTAFSLFFIGNLVASEAALAAIINFGELNIPLKKNGFPYNPLDIKLDVVKSDAADDYLLWRSDRVTVNGKITDNEFRIWGLENALFYALTYGETDMEPGAIVAFCGYDAGDNNGWADPMNGSSLWINEERPIPYLPIQGEVPQTYEKFQFDFRAAAVLDNKSLSITHTAPPFGNKGHKDPFKYNPAALTFIGDTQKTTIGDIFARLQNDGHIWNPRDPRPREDLPLGQQEVESVPEPTSTLGVVVVLGAVPVLKKEYAKKKKKKDQDA